MLKDKVHCMASGSVEGVQKFYFYAEHRDSSRSHLFMVECSLTLSTKKLRLFSRRPLRERMTHSCTMKHL